MQAKLEATVSGDVAKEFKQASRGLNQCAAFDAALRLFILYRSKPMFVKQPSGSLDPVILKFNSELNSDASDNIDRGFMPTPVL